MLGAVFADTRPHLILHAGCGGEKLPEWLNGEAVRLDIDPAVEPDIVANMTNLGNIGPFDAVYCCHALEHLYPHEVGRALAEFRRVLRPDGFAVIFVPDLEDARPTEEVLFVSPGGPITGLDLFYGCRSRIESEPHMAHHSGFVAPSLDRALRDAGFGTVLVNRLNCFNLMGVGKVQ